MTIRNHDVRPWPNLIVLLLCLFVPTLGLLFVLSLAMSTLSLGIGAISTWWRTRGSM